MNPVGTPRGLAVDVAVAFDLLSHLAEDVREDDVVLGGVGFGDLVDLRLCRIHDIVGVAFGVVAHLHDAGAGLDEAAQHRLLADDRGVVAGIGRGRHRGDEGVQVGGAADAGEVAGLRQIVRHRHRVRGLTAGVEVEDRLIDGFVSRLVEVIAFHRLDAVGDGVPSTGASRRARSARPRRPAAGSSDRHSPDRCSLKFLFLQAHRHSPAIAVIRLQRPPTVPGPGPGSSTQG
jgi:hypothetical protein